MGSRFLCDAEKLVDIAFPIPNMDAALRFIEERGGLLQILQPADAFLLFDRNPGRVNPLFERVTPLELLSRPELHRRDAEMESLGGDYETGMHQETAHGMQAKVAWGLLAAGHSISKPYRQRIFSLKREFGCVVQLQNPSRSDQNMGMA